MWRASCRCSHDAYIRLMLAIVNVVGHRHEATLVVFLMTPWP